MDRNLQKSGLINLFVLLGVAVSALVVARMGASLSGQLAAVITGIGALVALVSWFQMRLEDRERLEALEYDELNRSKGSSGLFQGQDVEGFPARRAREQFQRWAIPVFTVLLALFEGVVAVVWWRQLEKPDSLTPFPQPLVTMSLFGLFFLVLFLMGRFSTALGKLEEGRLLRPGSSFALLGAYASLVAAAAMAGSKIDIPTLDLIVAKVLTAFLMLVAVETVFNLVFELYRPRIRGSRPRPLYESRLVGLLAHPEDVFSTAAHALDYQFGFKVSETWFYQFLRRALGWLLLLQVGVLLLSTCVVVIEPGERGLLERWGRLVEARGELAPGAHVTLPWPVDRVKRFRTEQLQTFIVGSQPEDDPLSQRTVLWNVAHSKEELLLVGNRRQGAVETGTAGERRTPPVSVLTVSFPVHFEISDLMAWAYRYEAPATLLQDIATRKVLAYLASSDIAEVMASGRLDAAEELRRAIQEEADTRELGVTVTFIGLQDIHPPVAVAAEFQGVVGATQAKEAAILNARAEAIRANANADAESFRVVAEAEAFKQRAEVNALARSALFTNQIPAFHAAPSVYVDRTYLQALVQSTADARKYVLLTTNTEDVLQFDLQEKIGRDLLDIRLPAVQ
jgi:regulator of protease activity HflC (stomatin/prohibitin superfamily)